MTKAEAEAAAAERNRDPAEAASRWLPREGEDGEWEVVRIKAVPGLKGPLKTSKDERPRPEPDDPRTSLERDIGPWAPGAG